MYRLARRSLVTTRAIREGETIVADMLTVKRPGHGIHPSQQEIVVGRTARRTIDADTVLLWEMI